MLSIALLFAQDFSYVHPFQMKKKITNTLKNYTNTVKIKQYKLKIVRYHGYSYIQNSSQTKFPLLRPIKKSYLIFIQKYTIFFDLALVKETWFVKNSECTNITCLDE